MYNIKYRYIMYEHYISLLEKYSPPQTQKQKCECIFYEYKEMIHDR